ncbi:sodium:solute symporter family transporter [Nonomuraea longicatena]|uniref:Cation acetate symporter n=1 Tax=Nonomuraea longicatena TaxID=83682 RepID=A0ABN1PSS2_9ACTN
MTGAALTGILLVLALVAAAGTVRPRRYTRVPDFYVNERAVRPWVNGAAISSEFTSAAACLGMAGLIATHGGPMLWYPVGAAAGFVVLLALVVAPLRRSGTFTLPDFAEWRLGSSRLRRFTTCWVLLIGLVFLVAQFHAAGTVTHLLTGLPPWTGWCAVAAAAGAVGLAGGVGSMTSVLASQFWLKLVVFVGVGLVLWCTWRYTRLPEPDVAGPAASFADTGVGGGLAGAADPSLPGVLAVLLACALGTAGLPHVVARVYASADGRGARRSIVAAQVLIGVFFVAPPLLGLLGHLRAADLPEGKVTADEIVLLLPSQMLPGAPGDVLTALMSAGAFAAFLATSCGVLGAVAGAVSACVSRAGVRAYRTVLALAVPAVLGLTAVTSPGSSVVMLLVAFSLSAATFTPLLVLGIWWWRLTSAGVVAGFLAGGGLTVVAMGLAQAGVRTGGVLAYPVALAVPLAFLAMVVISLLTPGHLPPGVPAMMARMHLPEQSVMPGPDRSSYGNDHST